MLVITDAEHKVMHVAIIPGLGLRIPSTWHAYFPVSENLPKVNDVFIPNLILQPWLASNQSEGEST